jgi:primosomal protein N' (replication factor Y)
MSSTGLAPLADVAVPLAVHATFTYSIPERLRDLIRLGSRVEVPIGPKRSTGFVVELHDRAPDATTKLRPIHAVLDEDEPALIPEIIELCRWAADYYLAPLGEMLRTALPANMASRSKRHVTLVADEALVAAALASKQILEPDLTLVAELRRRPLPFAAALEASSRTVIERLRDAGLVTIGDTFQDAKGVRYDRCVVWCRPGFAGAAPPPPG